MRSKLKLDVCRMMPSQFGIIVILLYSQYLQSVNFILGFFFKGFLQNFHGVLRQRQQTSRDLAVAFGLMSIPHGSTSHFGGFISDGGVLINFPVSSLSRISVDTTPATPSAWQTSAPSALRREAAPSSRTTGSTPRSRSPMR